MGNSARPPPNVLFSLRLWREPLGEHSGEWRGEIKNVTTGEVRFFRQWSEIGGWVAHMVDGSVPPSCINLLDTR